MSSEMTVVDPQIVKAEVVGYIGSIVEDARALALTITNDETAAQAAELGQRVKEKITWLKARRVAVYKPLADATENVRLEYDTPLKLADQIEKTLAAALISYKQKKRAEEERLRLAAEAEARRQREEAARKEREAQAERERIIREREAAEQRKRDEAIAAENARKAAEEATRRDAEAKAKAEADARAAQLKAEEEARLRNAQEAHDQGLADRSEEILDAQQPVAPLPAPLPSAVDLHEASLKKIRLEEEAKAEESRKAEAKAAEDKQRAEEAEHLRKLDEEAAQARQRAAEADAVASSQVTVARPDERMRTNISWKYDVPNVEALKKLALAVAQGRAPVEYLGFDPEQPQKFRAAAIQKDVTRLKDQFQGDAIGIRTWPEESGSFKAPATV